MYPAYPRHFFSLRGLVHICIPHTGTPCGRVMGQRSYRLSWVFPFGTALPSPFVPLLYHNLGDLSRGFLSFFKKLFEVPDGGWRLTLSPRTTMGLPHISWVRSYLPLTLLIIADNSQKSTWQIAQNRDFYFLKLCATFRLTNCWRCVIMEILRASPVGAPPKKPPQKWGGFRINLQFPIHWAWER